MRGTCCETSMFPFYLVLLYVLVFLVNDLTSKGYRWCAGVVMVPGSATTTVECRYASRPTPPGQKAGSCLESRGVCRGACRSDCTRFWLCGAQRTAGWPLLAGLLRGESVIGAVTRPVRASLCQSAVPESQTQAVLGPARVAFRRPPSGQRRVALGFSGESTNHSPTLSLHSCTPTPPHPTPSAPHRTAPHSSPQEISPSSSDLFTTQHDSRLATRDSRLQPQPRQYPRSATPVTMVFHQVVAALVLLLAVAATSGAVLAASVRGRGRGRRAPGSGSGLLQASSRSSVPFPCPGAMDFVPEDMPNWGPETRIGQDMLYGWNPQLAKTPATLALGDSHGAAWSRSESGARAPRPFRASLSFNDGGLMSCVSMTANSDVEASPFAFGNSLGDSNSWGTFMRDTIALGFSSDYSDDTESVFSRLFAASDTWNATDAAVRARFAELAKAGACTGPRSLSVLDSVVTIALSSGQPGCSTLDPTFVRDWNKLPKSIQSKKDALAFTEFTKTYGVLIPFGAVYGAARSYISIFNSSVIYVGYPPSEGSIQQIQWPKNFTQPSCETADAAVLTLSAWTRLRYMFSELDDGVFGAFSTWYSSGYALQPDGVARQATDLVKRHAAWFDPLPGCSPM